VQVHVGERELKLVLEVTHLHRGVAAAIQILAQPQQRAQRPRPLLTPVALR
jgi:hypothetical protein